MTVDSQTKRLFESLGADRIGSQFDSINNAIRIRNEFGCGIESIPNSLALTMLFEFGTNSVSSADLNRDRSVQMSRGILPTYYLGWSSDPSVH